MEIAAEMAIRMRLDTAIKEYLDYIIHHNKKNYLILNYNFMEVTPIKVTVHPSGAGTGIRMLNLWKKERLKSGAKEKDKPVPFLIPRSYNVFL